MVDDERKKILININYGKWDGSANVGDNKRDNDVTRTSTQQAAWSIQYLSIH